MEAYLHELYFLSPNGNAFSEIHLLIRALPCINIETSKRWIIFQYKNVASVTITTTFTIIIMRTHIKISQNLIKETSIYWTVGIISVTGVTLIEIATYMTLFLLPNVYRSKYVIWQIQTYDLGNDLPPLYFISFKIIFSFV